MSNKRDLKAFVRFDGSGRIVAGSLILRKKKPKVGKWHEIQAYECCNYIPTTTTTTTQGGGVTPTAFVQSYWLNTEDACNTTAYGSLVFYSSSSTIEAGVAIFSDASLTTPVTLGRVILAGPFNMTKYVVGVGGVLSNIYCIGSFWFGPTAEIACSEGSPAEFLNIAVDDNSGPLYPGTTIYANFASAGFSIGQTVYIRFSPGFAATRSILITSSTTATIVGELVAC